jgi:hypothetical protein
MTNGVDSRFHPCPAVFWSNGIKTYFWMGTRGPVQTNLSVIQGISGLTGISYRSAHNIPSLLQTNFAWQERLFEISSPKVLGGEVFEKTDCYRIQGAGRGKREYEIWIGKSDYLLRKIKTTYPGSWDEEVHQDIRLDQQVSADNLILPPAKPIENPAEH